MRKTKYHIGAIVLAAVNLLFSVLIFFNVGIDIFSFASMGLHSAEMVRHSIIQIVCLAASVVFFVTILLKRLELTSIYWFALAISFILYLGFGLITGVVVVLCLAAIGMSMVLKKAKTAVVNALVLIPAAILVVLELLLFIFSGVMSILIIASVPWFPAAPLIPVGATCLMLLEKRRAA